jgi:hypothetical protein
MRKLTVLPLCGLTVLLLFGLTAGPAAAGVSDWRPDFAGEVPYEEIQPILDELVASSDRVRYEIMGTSAGGHDLYLVIVARPDVLAHLDDHLDFRQLMLDDPAAAQTRLAAAPGDVKVPVFINCSIHGNEPNGVDAGLVMLRRLATAGEDDLEAQRILDECIVLFNICQNPDGRIADTRANSSGFDMNRDFLLLTQPETQATAAQIARWVPTVFLDLHGYYSYYLMEPCTAPHNPNYEFDLLIGSALPTSLAMEARINVETRRPVKIAYRDLKGGFEDYSPIYTPMYAMYYGAAGMTLETTARDETGTACHFWAIWAGALHAADNKTRLLHDQAEQFRRGVEGIPQPDGDVTFPEAYVIPAASPLQRAPLQAARMVEKLQAAGVEVYRAATVFELGGVPYPAGTYVVPMRQSLRGLANTWLWQGTDLSAVKSMYSTCATNLTQLLGFDRVIVEEPLGDVSLTPMGETAPAGAVAGEGECYLLANDSVEAVKMVNALLDEDVTVEITTAASEAAPLGTYVVVDAPPALLDELAAAYRLKLAASARPAETKLLHDMTLAVAGGADTRYVLRELGFDFDVVGTDATLGDYEVFVNTSTGFTATKVKTYVKQGGGYVGLGYAGTASNLGRLLPVRFGATALSGANAIVRASFESETLVGAGFSADDWGFVSRPVWYTNLGDSVTVEARYGDQDDWFICGYWAERDAARGQAAVISGARGDGEIVFIGFAPTFRAYPEHHFRLIANSVWEVAD